MSEDEGVHKLGGGGSAVLNCTHCQNEMLGEFSVIS